MVVVLVISIVLMAGSFKGILLKIQGKSLKDFIHGDKIFDNLSKIVLHYTNGKRKDQRSRFRNEAYRLFCRTTVASSN
jgi:hypothetical protein